MANPLTSEEMKSLRQFHVLEIGAAELYRTNRRWLKDEELARTLKEFGDVEIEHRDTLRQFIAKYGGKPAWISHFARTGATVVASLVNLFGVRARLRFECAVERKAVRDYTMALEMAKNEELRSLFEKYRGHEQHHIDVMTKLLERGRS